MRIKTVVSHDKTCMMLSIAEHPHCTCGIEAKLRTQVADLTTENKELIARLKPAEFFITELLALEQICPLVCRSEANEVIDVVMAEISRLENECEAKEHENFALAANNCIDKKGIVGNDGGTPVCPKAAKDKDLKTALEKIKDECFEWMEGAGMPEFENYGRWFGMAKQALKPEADDESSQNS